MKLTSAEAAKLLRKLNEEYQEIIDTEELSREFTAAVEENIESVKPEYNYRATQKQLEELEIKICKLKHAINVFNSTTVIPEFNITIDQMLVYLPQLTERRNKYISMKNKLPKARLRSEYGSSSNIIDYRYLNYRLEEVKEDFKKVSLELSKAQTALDLVNSTVSFEFTF